MAPQNKAMPASTRLNARLLGRLKSAAGQWVDEPEIGRSIGLTGLRLEREADRLQGLGFAIEREDSRLRLVAEPDLLFADEIGGLLDTSVVGRQVAVYQSLGSTNDAAWELAAAGAAEGAVVLAEEQTGGRGRMGRCWHSPQGGLWMSVLLRPNPPAERATVLTMAASVAVAKAARKLAGCNATIRWPNDILIGAKKVAGVMVETRSSQELHGVFILGIGVNANCADFPEEIGQIATSLALHAGRTVRRADLARLILKLLDELYQQVLHGEHAAVGEEWMAMSSTIGQRITIIRNGRTYKGEVVDMDPVAGLMVRLDSGFVRAFKGEHVTVAK